MSLNQIPEMSLLLECSNAVEENSLNRNQTRSLRQHWKKIVFLVAVIAIACPMAALSGPEATPPPKKAADKVVIEKKPEANPLCFLDGKICIDIQERLRFEARENTF